MPIHTASAATTAMVMITALLFCGSTGSVDVDGVDGAVVGSVVGAVVGSVVGAVVGSVVGAVVGSVVGALGSSLGRLR